MSRMVEEFWAHLNDWGDRLALKDKEHCFSYRQLKEEVERRSQHLQALGAQRIGLALDNGVEWILWDLAIVHARRVSVPIPGFFSAQQQRHVLENAGVDLLIYDRTSQASLPLGLFEPLQTLGMAQRVLAQYPEVPVGTQKITYTSGTTGQPKGVCLSIEQQLQVAKSLWQATECADIQRHLCVLPLATLLENLAGVYSPLWGGACIEVSGLSEVGLSGASGFEVQRFLTKLHQVQPNSLILLPQLLLALVTAAEQGFLPPHRLSFIAVGGGHISRQLLERAKQQQLPVFEGYGLSECASVVCLNTPQARRLGTVGRPLAHVQLKLSEDQEVLVKGSSMLGYLGEPSSHSEWMTTGDLGQLDAEGFLQLKGRRKNQFITAYGRNLNPEWIEAELTQQSCIAQAWVYGEALPRNWAVLVPRGATRTQAELQAAVDQVNAALPDYARIHHWLLEPQPFTADRGLTTANGRLRRMALFEHYRAQLPLQPLV